MQNLKCYLALCLVLQMVCPLCHQIYRSRENFSYHMRGVHGVGKPIQCELCGESGFKTQTQYFKHKRACRGKLEGKILTVKIFENRDGQGKM